MSKIRILAIPPDTHGVGKYRILDPYKFIGDHYEYELNKSTGEVEKRFKEGFEKPNGDQFGD